MSERVMHPTTVPSWLSWYRRLRPAEMPRARDLNMARARAPSRLAVYTSVFRGDKHLPYLRLEDMLGHDRPLPTPPHEWLKRLNIDQEMWRAHISPDLSKDSMQYHQRYHNYSPVSIMLPSGGGVGVGVGGGVGAGVGAGAGAGARRGAEGAWCGWVAGTVLLALLVLVVRAAEKCLDKKLFNYTRRPSEEWHTPNVTATSLLHQTLDVSMPNLDDSEFSSPTHHSPDLPPPYSECALNSGTNGHKILNKLNTEEPPPPYSACVVAFSNKDIPTVHIHRGHTIEEPQTSSEVDNVQNNLIENRYRMEGEQNYDDAIRVELVFDNGRIVERTIDVESTESVPEIVAHVGETVIGKILDDNVTYIDENETNSQERVIFV